MKSKTSKTTKRVRFAAATALVAVTLTIVAGVLPGAVAAEAVTDAPVFVSKLAADATPGHLVAADPALAFEAATRIRTATVIEPVVVAPVRTTSTRKSTAATTTAAPAAAAPAAAVDEAAQAQSILDGYIAKYPILAGTTVSFGDARGAQAIAYYKSGRIVISTTHTASLSRIIGHEIWHVIDYRDNGVIDWGENVPPAL